MAFLVLDSNIPLTTGSGSYSLGMHVKFLVGGQITGARYYHLGGNAAHPRTLKIYNSAGTLLGTTNSTTETDTLAAWKYASLATPINVSVNDEIVVVYDTFSDTFAWNNGAPSFVNASLQTFTDGHYISPSGSFPTNTGAFFYGVDLEYTPTAPPTGTTFDPGFNTANFTYSSGNLVAAGVTDSSQQSTRSSVGFATGKIYFEGTIVAKGGTGAVGVGVGNASNGSGFLGGTNNGFVYAGFGNVYTNSATIGSGWQALAVNDVCCVAFDIGNKKIWFRKNANNWDETAGHDPGSNVGGFDMTTLLTANGTVYPSMNSFNAGDSVRMNFGATAFAQTVPTGFAGPDSGAGPGPSAAQARVMVMA